LIEQHFHNCNAEINFLKNEVVKNSNTFIQFNSQTTETIADCKNCFFIFRGLIYRNTYCENCKTPAISFWKGRAFRRFRLKICCRWSRSQNTWHRRNAWEEQINFASKSTSFNWPISIFESGSLKYKYFSKINKHWEPSWRVRK